MYYQEYYIMLLVLLRMHLLFLLSIKLPMQYTMDLDIAFQLHILFHVL